MFNLNFKSMKKNFIFLIAALCCAGMISATEGALSGKFTINAAGDQIVFSQGNLQATTTDLGANWTWSFAANQWDIIGAAAANTAITGNGTVNANGTVDLFGWSTAATYYGIQYDYDNNSYAGDFVDWGNNAITNGGNEANKWRTLTNAELVYIFRTRANAANLYGQAVVNDIHGCILLPDGADPAALGFTATPNDWTTNQYSGDSWTTLADAGAVFLPCAGYRFKQMVVDIGLYGNGWYGNYSTATPIDEDIRSSMEIGENYVAYDYTMNRCYGASVRLVQAAPGGTTALDNAAVDAKAVKRIVDGKLLIERDGKAFNALGAEVK